MASAAVHVPVSARSRVWLQRDAPPKDAGGTEGDGRCACTADGRAPLDPLFNDAFVRIFGAEESKRMTGRFVDCILEAAGLEPMGEVESVHAEHTGLDGSVSCRSARFDVRIVAQNGIMGLEAQRREAPVADRSTFYASRIMSTATGVGTDFRDLPRVVVVTLYDAPAPFPDSEGYIAVHRPVWRIGEDAYPGSDRMVFVLVELEKFRRRYNDLDGGVLGDELTAWLYLLTSGYGSREEMEAMEERFPTMEEFAQQYGFAVGDPKLVQAYQDYGDAVSEEITFRNLVKSQAEEEWRAKGLAEGRAEGLAEGLAEGRAEGRAKGLAEGRAEGRAEIFRKMRSLGIGEDLIAQMQ